MPVPVNIRAPKKGRKKKKKRLHNFYKKIINRPNIWQTQLQNNHLETVRFPRMSLKREVPAISFNKKGRRLLNSSKPQTLEFHFRDRETSDTNFLQMGKRGGLVRVPSTPLPNKNKIKWNERWGTNPTTSFNISRTWISRCLKKNGKLSVKRKKTVKVFFSFFLFFCFFFLFVLSFFFFFCSFWSSFLLFCLFRVYKKEVSRKGGVIIHCCYTYQKYQNLKPGSTSIAQVNFARRDLLNICKEKKKIQLGKCKC